MKHKTNVALVLLLAILIGSLGQILTVKANAQLLGVALKTSAPAAVSTTTTVATSSFFSASSGNSAFGGGSYLVFGGGTDAIDVLTITTGQFNGRVVDSLSVTYDIAYQVASGVSGTVDFGTYTNKTYNNSSTYNNYVKPNTFVPMGSYSFLTGIDSFNGDSNITLSGFASAANASIAAGQDLEIVFNAGAAPFNLLAPDGDYLLNSSATVNVVEEQLNVPEPSVVGFLGGFAVSGVFLWKRRRREHSI